MGTSNSATNKTSTSPVSGSLPQWAQTGTTDYNKLNSALQTLPMNAAVQTIGNAGLGQASQDAISKLQGMGGSNPWMDQAASGLQNIGQISGDNYQSIFDQAGQGGAANQYLTSTANGDYLNGSPYLDSIISKGASDIANQTNNMFAAGGRYGSGANQGVLSDSIANYANNLRNENYQAERQNQLSAANALESAQQGRLGIQNSAASGLANVQGQNAQNQLSANQALGSLGQNSFTNQLNAQTGAANIENQGMNNMLNMISQLGNVQNNKMFDSNQQTQIGNTIDQRTQQGLNDLINQWTNSDNEDWARLGGLLSAAQGSAGSYGTQSQTSSQPANILGALGSLISKWPSDRRLKENIAPVGERNGFKLYEWNYRGMTKRWRGVMADEVAKIRPDAVERGSDGYDLVDYSKLGFDMEAA